jgi:transcriptional regulator with XRE-family HTH domain
MKNKKTKSNGYVINIEEIRAKYGQPTFARLLRSTRTRDDLTQNEMAKKLKISVSHLSDLENERKYVSVARAAEFARRMKEPIELFVTYALRDQIRLAGLDFEVKIS